MFQALRDLDRFIHTPISHPDRFSMYKKLRTKILAARSECDEVFFPYGKFKGFLWMDGGAVHFIKITMNLMALKSTGRYYLSGGFSHWSPRLRTTPLFCAACYMQ